MLYQRPQLCRRRPEGSRLKPDSSSAVLFTFAMASGWHQFVVSNNSFVVGRHSSPGGLWLRSAVAPTLCKYERVGFSPVSDIALSSATWLLAAPEE
jgi:hypothetical protein